MIDLIPYVYAAGTDIITGIPGPVDPNTTDGILAYIQNLYLLSLGLAGALALGSIVYGAIQYTMSQGNSTKLTEAWDRILQALIGILLLVGASAILTVVNPGLTSLELPSLVEVTPEDIELIRLGNLPEYSKYEDGSSSAGMANESTIPPTDSCKKDPKKCVSLGAAGFTCKPGANCVAHTQIAKGLECVAKALGVKNSAIRITEGYPQNVDHIDPRHSNGCSADLTFIPAKSCDDIKNFMSKLSGCGLTGLNEYTNGDYVGCGKKTPKGYGNHIHVNGCPRGTQ